MSIIQRYIYRQLLVTLGAVVAIVFGVLLILNQIGEISAFKNEYLFLDSVYYSAAITAGSLFSYFSLIVVITVLVVTGNMVEKNEIRILQASGYSLFEIIRVMLVAVLVCSTLFVVVDNYLFSKLRQHASEFKIARKYPWLANRSFNVWSSKDGTFVHFFDVQRNGSFRRAQVYRFASDTLSIGQSEEGQITNSNFIFNKAHTTVIGDTTITSSFVDKMEIASDYNVDLLLLENIQNSFLSVFELYRLAAFKGESEQENPYLVIFFQRLLFPLNICALAFFAVTFVFGPTRSVSAGTRVSIGILTGLAFYVLEEFAVPAHLLFQWPVAVATLLPAVLALVGGMFNLRYKR